MLLVAGRRFEPATVCCSDIAMTLISALRRNVSTSRRALTIDGGFLRIRAVTDPIYSERAGPWNRLGPRRRVRAPALAFDALPPISIVLLSHNHYDHCDLPTLGMLAKRFDPLVVTPLGNGRFARTAGIRRVEELDWWQSAELSGVPITIAPAHHFSARGPFDRNRALWRGFMLTADRARIYFAGDTAYAPFFHEIRQRLGPIDVALLPIGAYEPRWLMQSVHMNPAEAVQQAHLDLGAGEASACTSARSR